MRRAAISARAGIGLRIGHMAEILAARPMLAWLEIHSETFCVAGGPRLAALEALRRDYPLSCHGVGLSLGSAEGPDEAHLARLRALYDRFEPGLASEHLAWCRAGGVYLPDLLPVPLTGEALAVVAGNIDRAQAALGRRLLIENPSRYVPDEAAEMDEPEFLAALVARTGCGLLLDLANVYVSAANLGIDPAAWLDALPLDAVEEVHVAGHGRARIGARELVIDDHGAAVPDAVWDLLALVLARTGPLPVLIERDRNLPGLADLIEEAARADALLGGAKA
ncbi:MAG: DUF692 domain-containing protein [Rhodospirillaceae bacterium]|jgi:uncharacterized protein|nr:DUF692 domain-containing protein [Rhodospirillaceae bacterium]